MAALSMLPRSWVERIFNRMNGTYGFDRFSGRFMSHHVVNGVDQGLENALETWAEDLSGFDGDAIKYGLDNLDPKFPPSSREFAAVCRRAPRKDKIMVEHKVSAEDVARGLEKLNAVKAKVEKPKDMLSWARKPRSPLALVAVIELATRDEDDRFVEILDDLRQAGRVVGDELNQRWDFAAQSWVGVAA